MNTIAHRVLRPFLILGACLVSFSSAANEAAIRQVVEAMLGVKVEGIQPAPIPGLFEVRYRTRDGMEIMYTDAQGANLINGNIYDSKTKRNLTEERLRKLNAISFDSLPLELAVKVQRGNGKRVMAMFTDPYCPACQQFERVLQQVDDITVYYFMFPVIRPERADHSRSVWCSPDRAKAWLDLAIRQKVPTASAACANPVDKVLELGRTLGVTSTPTTYFANGERISGGMPVDRLRIVLDSAAAQTGKAK